MFAFNIINYTKLYLGKPVLSTRDMVNEAEKKNSFSQRVNKIGEWGKIIVFLQKRRDGYQQGVKIKKNITHRRRGGG